MQTYSFLEVQASIVGPGGAIALGASSGADEEGISIDANSEIDVMTIGAGGEGMHSLRADKSGRVTVRLLKTSPTNALLSAMYAFQTSSAALHGQNTITILDSNRGDVISCRQVAFLKAPALSYAAVAGSVDWEFNAVTIDRTLSA